MLQVSIQKQLEAFALQVSFVLASHGITVLWGTGEVHVAVHRALVRADHGKLGKKPAFTSLIAK